MESCEDRRDRIRSILLCAIERFNEREKYLIENDLSERCICSKFSYYLTQEMQNTAFHEYCVDVEYNRGYDEIDHDIKRLFFVPITVDLIVHKRGHSDSDENNLICVEMKKTTNRTGCADDEERLAKMVNWEYGYAYQAGYMILIDMKEKKLKIKEEFPKKDERIRRKSCRNAEGRTK